MMNERLAEAANARGAGAGAPRAACARSRLGVGPLPAGGGAARIAVELAQVRAGDDGYSPAEYREALRDVIRHCIYAVDKNPLAVDLCKGRPLD